MQKLFAPQAGDPSASALKSTNCKHFKARLKANAEVCLCVILAVLSFSVPALAQSSQGGVVAVSDIQAAQLLIVGGKLEEAKTLLVRDLQSKPSDSETLFLLATIAVSQKDYDTAISYYRRILVNEPDVERVRLELARAFFLKGDYDNADRQFRFARAGNISDTAKANIDQFLGAINILRQWTFNFALSLAPDTNENAATSASQIDIYGLPFALDSNARRRSGLGIAGDVGGEWSPLLFGNVKARIGADAYRVEYSGGQFDDMTISTYAGPQLIFGDWDISALASGFERWYGNKLYVNGGGGRIAADIGITSNLLLSGSVGLQTVSYKYIPAQNGELSSGQLQASYVFSPSTVFTFQTGINRQDAVTAPYSYSGYWLSSDYGQDLPFGFSADLSPSYYVTRYDAPLEGFGVKRSDAAIMVGLSVLNRRLDYHGFTPRFSYTYTNQHSSIPLYSYKRNQFQIGVTSRF